MDNNRAQAYKTKVSNNPPWSDKFSQYLTLSIVARDALPLELARGIGVAHSTVMGWTSGRKVPVSKEIVAAAESYLGIPPGELTALLPNKPLERFRSQMSEGCHTKFINILGNILLDKDMTPSDLARAMGKETANVIRWFSRGVLPKSDLVAQIEDVLDIERGELERHVPEGERTVDRRQIGRVSRGRMTLAGRETIGKRMRMLWVNRRKNNSKEDYQKKIDAGVWWGGRTAQEKLAHTRAIMKRRDIVLPRSPRRLMMRVRGTVGRIIHPNTTGAKFVMCSMCKTALCRSDFLLSHSDNYFHSECWNVWCQRGGDTSLSRKVAWSWERPPDLDRLIPQWLAHNILGLSYGKISSLYAKGYSYRAVGQAVKRAEKYIPERWGQLFVAKGRESSNIHRMLAYCSVSEVIEIAQGKHELSDSTDYASVSARYSHPVEKPPPLDLGEISDNRLAQLLAEQITATFTRKGQAARAIGLHYQTLNRILDPEKADKHFSSKFGESATRVRSRYMNEHVWEALSDFLDISVPQLKAMWHPGSKPVPMPSKTVESQRDIPAVASTDARQLSFTDA